jgi:hypothetical protein
MRDSDAITQLTLQAHEELLAQGIRYAWFQCRPGRFLITRRRSIGTACCAHP